MNEIQTLIDQRDNETDAAKIEALQAQIDASVAALPAAHIEDNSDIDRLFASLG